LVYYVAFSTASREAFALLDGFSPDRLKKRPLEMPDHNNHQAPITIAMVPFRAGARRIIWRLRRRRCGGGRPESCTIEPAAR
jgi:hypothetical protein